MAPAPSRKRKSPEPAPQFDYNDGPGTPTSSPAKKKLKITQTQKKTLMDNLQLESMCDSTSSLLITIMGTRSDSTLHQLPSGRVNCVPTTLSRPRTYARESKDASTVFP